MTDDERALMHDLYGRTVDSALSVCELVRCIGGCNRPLRNILWEMKNAIQSLEDSLNEAEEKLDNITGKT